SSFFIDVGVDEPRDLAVQKVEVEPPVVAPGAPYSVRVHVRSTGQSAVENELSCQVEDDADQRPDRRPVKFGAGGGEVVVVFERTAPNIKLAEGAPDRPMQVTVQLGTRDALPFNNVRHATFALRGRRKLLTIVPGEPPDPFPWVAALEARAATGAVGA